MADAVESSALADDTPGQHRSLAGPDALLAGVTIGGALLSMGHRVSAGPAQPEDLMRPSVPSAARRPLATRRGRHHRATPGSPSAHNQADLHARIHPLQTIVNQPVFGDRNLQIANRASRSVISPRFRKRAQSRHSARLSAQG
jgi:hypothetical protein